MSDDETTVAERVRIIANLMASGQYRTRLTELELCKRWGVGQAQFRRYSAEASRWLKLDVNELEDLKTRNIMTLERLVQDALVRQNTMTGLPDYRSANDALRLMWEMVGPSDKDERDVSEYTDEEIAALAEKALQTLKRKPDKQDGGNGTPEGS